jgi:hypothetical protein
MKTEQKQNKNVTNKKNGHAIGSAQDQNQQTLDAMSPGIRRTDVNSSGVPDTTTIYSCNQPFPRLWILFSFILGKKTREKIFEPLFHEFLKDYLLARRYKTKWAKRWLSFCFVCKTSAMIIGCFRVMLGEKAMNLFWAILTPTVKEYIQNIFKRS